MRIGCLQFAPALGEVEKNIARADAILRESLADGQPLDLLILPELAFTGYNFPSLDAITPHLEPTTAGRSAAWACATARRLGCYVTVGYPEVTLEEPARRFNSAVTASPAGAVLFNYRKSFLYYTDETWAAEGEGFLRADVPRLGRLSMGICMDMNPYKFTSPWEAYEFAQHALDYDAGLIAMPMAWLTRLSLEELTDDPKSPDMDTLYYWLNRLYPVIEKSKKDPREVIFATGNRCGTEGDVHYAGTSAVMGIRGGKIRIYGMLGRREERLLLVDTTKPISD